MVKRSAWGWKEHEGAVSTEAETQTYPGGGRLLDYLKGLKVGQSDNDQKTFCGYRAAGGGGAQRMTYRVRSNALADLQMPNFKSRTTSESGVKELASEAQGSVFCC
jgi:hypothetical protein